MANGFPLCGTGHQSFARGTSFRVHPSLRARGQWHRPSTCHHVGRGTRAPTTERPRPRRAAPATGATCSPDCVGIRDCPGPSALGRTQRGYRAMPRARIGREPTDRGRDWGSRHPAALWCGRCLPLRIHSRSSSSTAPTRIENVLHPADIPAGACSHPPGSTASALTGSGPEMRRTMSAKSIVTISFVGDRMSWVSFFSAIS